MEFSRNQFFAVGLIVLLLGLQFHMFDSFTLNEKTTQFLASHLADNQASSTVLPALGPAARKVIHPPTWLGWSLISVGSVLVLHSFGMKKAGG